MLVITYEGNSGDYFVVCGAGEEFAGTLLEFQEEFPSYMMKDS
jgi:hypothetical protein